MERRFYYLNINHVATFLYYLDEMILHNHVIANDEIIIKFVNDISSRNQSIIYHAYPLLIRVGLFKYPVSVGMYQYLKALTGYNPLDIKEEEKEEENEQKLEYTIKK